MQGHYPQMYVIRAPGPKALDVTFSERVTGPEGLRAIAQAFALADAGSVTSAICDLTGVERGPGNYLELAVALATRIRPDMRIGFVATRAQRPFVQRLARFSGIRDGLGLFETRKEAERWLAEASSIHGASSARRRHYREIAQPRLATSSTQDKRGAA